MTKGTVLTLGTEMTIGTVMTLLAVMKLVKENTRTDNTKYLNTEKYKRQKTSESLRL